MSRIQCFLVEPVYSETVKLNSGKPSIEHWRRTDTGETKEHPHQFGAGAMWFAPWLEERAGKQFVGDDGKPRPQPWGLGPDGRILIVETPGGGWIIDSRASNCTMKDDNVHRCWIRHGTPPNVTVDKNGNTCGAGAGSIQAGSYHGFLRNGWLEE